jgi:hypothetical protein
MTRRRSLVQLGVLIGGLTLGGALLAVAPTFSAEDAQQRPTSPAQVQPIRIGGGTFEASGVVAVPGTRGVLFVDDGRPNEVMWMEIGQDGRAGRAVPVALGITVVDMEGITTDGTYFYVVGSQSKPEGVNGLGLVRFRFDPATRRVSDATGMSRLKEYLANHVAELASARTRTGEQVLNIEGLAWDAERSRLLLGFRAPVPNGQALVVPLKMRNPQAAVAADNLVVDGLIRLNLGGAGIRGFEQVVGDRTFRIIAAAETARAGFQLLRWDGRTASGFEAVTAFHANLKPEGVTTAPVPGASTLVVFDTSRYALLP